MRTRGRPGRATGAAVVALFVLGVGVATTRSTGPPQPAPSGGQAVARVGQPEPAAAAEPVPAVPVAPTLEPVPAVPVAPPAGEPAIAPPPLRLAASPPPPPPAALDRPLVMQGPTGTGTGTGTWALVIGINNYPGSASDLRSAVNDADDVDAALSAMGVPVAQRLVLRDGQATAAAIREAVTWLVAQAGPDATAVLFYAGHVRKVGVTSEALVAADGGLMEDRELGERLSHLLARRAWLAFAACYGGGFTELLAPGRVLTGAAPADGLAYESSEFGRSFLVQYMVREAMIEGRAGSSVQAAFSYAVAELLRKHPGRVPVQIDLALGPIDLRPPAPVPPPAPITTIPTTPPTTAPCRQLLIFACRT